MFLQIRSIPTYDPLLCRERTVVRLVDFRQHTAISNEHITNLCKTKSGASEGEQPKNPSQIIATQNLKIVVSLFMRQKLLHFEWLAFISYRQVPRTTEKRNGAQLKNDKKKGWQAKIKRKLIRKLQFLDFIAFSKFKFKFVSHKWQW